MATNKINAKRAVKVVPSDTVRIPDPSSWRESGTATSTTANKLVDSAATFLSLDIKTGSIVHNTTDGTIATIISIDSDTSITLSADIMANTEDYVLYRDAAKDCALYIGGAGNLEVIMNGGETIVFSGVLAGSMFPINVSQVLSSNTTATDIVALF